MRRSTIEPRCGRATGLSWELLQPRPQGSPRRMWRPAGEERGSADHHHRIDLERSALGQRRNLDGGTRRVRLAEVFGHHRVDLGELAQVGQVQARSEEHTSELQSLMRISYAVFCLKKKSTRI